MKQSNNTTQQKSYTKSYVKTHAYQQLEKEVNDKHKKLTSQSWRGDLSKKGLKMISWGDLKELEVK